MLKKLIIFVKVTSILLLLISCRSVENMEEYTMRFQNIHEFSDWLASKGNRVTLKRVIIPNKEKDLFNLDRESGDFVINGEDNLCMLFESRKKWEYAPKFFDDMGKAFSSKKKNEVKTYWNVRCFGMKK